MTATPPRVLFISPSFFGYERSIRAALEDRGYEVDFVDERPSNTALARALVRVNPRLLGPMVDRHYERVLARLGGAQYDVVLVVKAEVVPEWFLEEMRRRSPGATTVFYTFDSVSNSPNCLRLLHRFDRSFSFDYIDVQAEPRLRYLPLFFAPEFHTPESSDADRSYELSFIGTLHSERYRAVNDLFRHFGSVYKFFYVQARWYYYVSRYITRTMSDVRRKDVIFRKLSRVQVANCFRRSKAVFDLQRSGQSGLTMRTFEVLASGAILVTTNPNVRREPFFDPNWVVVVEDSSDREAVARIERALRSERQEPRAPGIEEYSLARWLDRLLSEN